MSTELLLNPTFWRDRAEEARAMAASFNDKEAQQAMYDVARSYDHLAGLAQRAKDLANGKRSK